MTGTCDIPYSDLRGARVVLGLSGGVDSSLCAALLKEQGLDVTAVFMKNWEEDDTDSFCAAAADRKDAEEVCRKLGIPFQAVNFAAEYWDQVFENFLAEYRSGRTPNPDILCNSEIKFRAFTDYAFLDLKADFIATGHYCRRTFAPGTAADSPGDSTVRLMRGSDAAKDQSYFLHAIDRKALARTLFPVGGMLKSEVRRQAAARQLSTATKKDSTGICFIGEKRLREFLRRFMPAKPGDIVTLQGEVIGTHEGLMFATIGQRKGLHIGGRRNGSGEPWFVAGKDIAKNRLIVVQGSDNPALYARGLTTAAPVWLDAPEAFPFACTCKIRYRQPDVPCTLNVRADGGLEVSFAGAVRAVAPGQYAVFYRDDECLGGAVIEAPVPGM